MTARQPPSRQLEQYLHLLAGAQPAGRLMEIRYAIAAGGMRRLFVRARRVDQAARAIRTLAPRSDVYCGVLLRARRAGGRDAVTPSHLVFVEIDHADALDRLRALTCPPSMTVSSGTPGHAHAYWTLQAPVEPAEVEQANRRLADHLGGDVASVDAARILRPPGTVSHKHQPPQPVQLADHDPARCYTLGELLHGLPPIPPQPVTASRGRAHPPRTELDEVLLAIPAADYVRALTGLEPRRNGKVNCPFHADDTPSLHLYEDGTFYCYGCGAGGSVYDFAGRLWSLETKGRAFLELRARLAESFGLRAGAGS